MKDQIKKLSRNEKIAVFIAVSLVGIFLLSPLFEITERFTGFSKNSLMPEQNEGELVIQELVIGSGQIAQAGDTVLVRYNGSLTDGTAVDSNTGKAPFTFTLGLGEVIEGLELGVLGMKEGGSRLLVIPSHLGYGGFQAGIVPPNSTLVYEVKLLQVIKNIISPQK